MHRRHVHTHSDARLHIHTIQMHFMLHTHSHICHHYSAHIAYTHIQTHICTHTHSDAPFHTHNTHAFYATHTLAHLSSLPAHIAHMHHTAWMRLIWGRDSTISATLCAQGNVK